MSIPDKISYYFLLGLSIVIVLGCVGGFACGVLILLWKLWPWSMLLPLLALLCTGVGYLADQVDGGI